MKSAELARLLPGVYRRTLAREGDREGAGAGSVMGSGGAADAAATGAAPPSPLAALLAAMEGLHAPCEAVLGELDRYFDPRRAPDDFVPFLARWVDLERYMPGRSRPGAEPLPGGTGRLRELVAEAVELSRWRGTGHGLVRFLEVATGVAGFTVEEAVAGPDGRRRPFHVRVRVPAAAAPQERLVRRIVEGEKPAYVTYELAVEAASAGGRRGGGRRGGETSKGPATPKKEEAGDGPETEEGRSGEPVPRGGEGRGAETRDDSSDEGGMPAAGEPADRDDDKES